MGIETTSSGKVINVHTSRVTYIINGKERTFNATTNKPVYEVMTEDGYPVMLNVPRVFRVHKEALRLAQPTLSPTDTFNSPQVGPKISSLPLLLSN
jgi:hypothetical protein